MTYKIFPQRQHIILYFPLLPQIYKTEFKITYIQT